MSFPAPPLSAKTGAARRGPRRAAQTLQTSPLPATRKQPVQKRAEFTVKAIIDAAHELLLKQGVDAVTTRQVAERAGVAIGTLYQYFPDRDAILMRLAYMIMDEEVSNTAHYLANLYRHSLEELIAGLYERSLDVERRMLELGHDFHRRHARHLNFGLYLRDKISSQPQDPEAMIAAMHRVIADHRDEIGETDRDLATFMIVRGMRNMVVTLVEERPDLLDSPALTPMLTRVAMAILAGKSGTGTGPAERDQSDPAEQAQR